MKQPGLALQRQMVGLCYRRTTVEDLPLFRDQKVVCFLYRQVPSAEETGIKRPRPRTDHCGGNAERRQHDRNPRVTGVGYGDPQFDHSDQRAHDRGPEACKEKYAGQATSELGNHRERK